MVKIPWMIMLAAITVAISPWRPAMAFEECGSLWNAYGPFDYWVHKDKLGIVEVNHFTTSVEQLRQGESGYLGADLDYVLRAFPNHPRALMSMIRLGQKERTEKPRGAHYSITCYFDRAIRFRPNDPMARMLYATYLFRGKKREEALGHLKIAEENSNDNANLHYNLGLIYFDLGQYDQALRHAQFAYRLGFTLPGLKAKLQKAGKWQEPPPNMFDAGFPANDSTEPAATGMDAPMDATGDKRGAP